MTTVLTWKEVICTHCYLSHSITLSTEPRIPAPGMLWLCNECDTLSVFDEKLDLREATPEEAARALRPTAIS